MKKLPILFIVLLIFAACQHSERLTKSDLNQELKAASPIILSQVHIINPTNGQISELSDVLIENGKITAIESNIDSSDVARINMKGKYLIPGFIDMHTHVFNEMDPRKTLNLFKAYGITGFREMAGSTELLKMRANGELPILTNQPQLLAMPGDLLMPNTAGDPEEAVEKVRQQKAEGADFVKIAWVTPEVFYATLAEGKQIGMRILGHVPGQVDMEMAADSGLVSVEHLGMNFSGLAVASTKKEELLAQAPSVPSIMKYMPEFATGLAHEMIEKKLINPMQGFSPEEFVRTTKILETYDQQKSIMAAKHYASAGMWQSPTLIRLKTSMLAFEQDNQSVSQLQYISPEEIAKWKEVTKSYDESLTKEQKDLLKMVYSKELELVKLFADQGVKMFAGSDAVTAGWVVPGYSLHQEFDELEKAGLSPLQVLQMATINGAEFLGKDEDLGTVAVGKMANLVILKENPLESVQNLHSIDAVIINGYYDEQKTLLDALE
ncbi:MAG: hypothetical protein CMO01_21260 [Thalassobius sp.]|nr:hypothetical protein [Thalassovita sp.]